MDSKWQFCLRLKRFYRTCFIADGRVSTHYEKGWNDAVTSLMASIGPLYKRQEPFLKTLLEDTQGLIPRAAVRDAMESYDSALSEAEAILGGEYGDYHAHLMEAVDKARTMRAALGLGAEGERR